MSFSTKKGNIGVLKIALDLIQRGCEISFVFSEESAIDLIAIQDSKIFTIQVKSRKKNKHNKVCIDGRRHTRPNKPTIKYTKENFQIYGIYCPDTDECFYLTNLGNRREYSLNFGLIRKGLLPIEEFKNFPPRDFNG